MRRRRPSALLGSKAIRKGAVREVPDAMVAAVTVAGTPAECRDRIEAYRSAGADAKQEVMNVISACTP